MKGKYLQFCLGVVAGGLLFSTTATAADYLTARATSQRFYLNGQPVQFEAYEIHGNNFVKLRDIGQAVDFGVTYDGSTNSVHIDSNAHYEQEVTAPVPSTTPTPSSLTEETVQTAIRNLRSVYPTGTEYPAPYISASNTPYGSAVPIVLAGRSCAVIPPLVLSPGGALTGQAGIKLGRVI